MSLSIGIKNAILVILVIFILHFVIKNIMIKKPLNNNPKREKTESFFDDNNSKAPVVTKVNMCNNNNDMAKSKEDMLKYVLGSNDDDLNKYFAENPVTEPVKETCPPPKSDIHQLPMINTCDPNIQAVGFGDLMQIKADCDLTQDKRNIMILNEYVNEKALNGGELYGGLQAYDYSDLDYSAPLN